MLGYQCASLVYIDPHILQSIIIIKLKKNYIYPTLAVLTYLKLEKSNSHTESLVLKFILDFIISSHKLFL